MSEQEKPEQAVLAPKEKWQKARPPRKDAPPVTGEPVPAIKVDEEFGRGPKLRDLDAAIEQELAEALGGMDAKEMLGEPQRNRTKPQPASAQGLRKARVMAVRPPDVFLDVPGQRVQGLLPVMQFPDGLPEIGMEVEVNVEGYDAANGLLLLSRKGAAVQVDWSSVAVNMIVEARVTATNNGGLSVEVNGIRGFLPISQIELFRVDDTNAYVNQKLKCVVTEVDPENRNLVVSRRILLDQEREVQRDKLWTELAEGQIREGTVRNILDFGAFVDLGGVDGLLPVGELSWQRVNDIRTVLSLGQKLRVVVLRLDHEKKKISLGLKQLEASPWDNAEVEYPRGTVITGKITRLEDFGAFVELEPGLEGLVHISELAQQRVRSPRDLVQVGQEVRAVVLNLDKAVHRISLSMKAVKPPKSEEVPAAAATEKKEEEPATPPKPPRPRTFPLKGGLGTPLPKFGTAQS